MDPGTLKKMNFLFYFSLRKISDIWFHSDLDFKIRSINSLLFDPGGIFTDPIQGKKRREIRI
jgi:hypothetical protein